MMKKTIRAQVMSGYLFITIIPVAITLATILSLFSINAEVSVLNQNRANQNATKDAVVGHYSWILGLGSTIQEGVDFTGSLDSNTCGLGKWMATVSPEDLQNPRIAEAIAKIKSPHDYIHAEAQRLIDLSQMNRNAAYIEYTNEIKPKVSEIIADITVITNEYATFAEQSTASLTKQIIKLMLFCVVLVLIGVIAAVIIGKTISRRISRPIEIVADYSQKLSLGHDNLNFDEVESLHLSDENEAATMIKAFQEMVKGIQDNVAVVKRVAAGDLTAFVDIRSSNDSLGQNLYHMVQSNDLMFAQILQIAGTVASSANQISQTSHALAGSATEQAGFTEQLSATMSEVNVLTLQNKQKVHDVIDVVGSIQTDINESGAKMEHLVQAVDEIRAASDRISAVIKTIEDIAFQTNILALNAAVEAARAGAAGKGFAVVADEVRNLASKSAVAANQTKELIENTISKSHNGSVMAKETGQTFSKIYDSLKKTIETVDSISAASEMQVTKISDVHQNIEKLLDLSTINAASCEQSSASSQEMYASAGELRQAMQKFNLRQRQYGQAYIPPEKRNDPEFVRTANENYRKALEHGVVQEQQLAFADPAAQNRY